MSSTAKRVLILGGGFAGLNCAQKLANNGDFEVTLLDAQNHHLFQPLLYQVATAALSATDIARSLRAVLAKAENVRVVMDRAEVIDWEKREVRSAGEVYKYDRLVVAVGARTSFFGRDEWQKHVFGLKSLRDALGIRSHILHALERAERISDEEETRRLMTIVIVGGGPTGVELAGAFSDLVRRALKADFRHIDPAHLRVVLMDALPNLLNGFDPSHSKYAADRLKELGVEIQLGAMVDEVREGGVHTKGGEWIEAETIIWAAGVQAQDICSQLPGERDRGGRLMVEPDLSLQGHPEIFAAGDIVNLVDKNGKKVPGLAPAATQMGNHIGKVLIEEKRLEGTRHAERKDSLRAAFSYLDKGHMAIVGKNRAVSQAGKMKLQGFPAWVAWLLIHVLFLVGFRNKLSVLLSWAFTYLFDKPGARVFSVEESGEGFLPREKG